jgi:hypothetical protein
MIHSYQPALKKLFRSIPTSDNAGRPIYEVSVPRLLLYFVLREKLRGNKEPDGLEEYYKKEL